MKKRRGLARSAALVSSALLLASCATAPGSGAKATAAGGSGKIVTAVASISAWGSILAEIGGEHVRVTSIITNPDTDPHDYEPTPADARLIAGATLVVENGVGYDSWLPKAVAASPNPDRTVIDVGRLTATADDGNPHRWYSPTDVAKVADRITAELKRIDPADAAYYDSRQQSFLNVALAGYHRLITEIRTRFAGIPVGASESIFAPLSDALGLKLLTPASFLRAISEGTDPSAADKATIDAQLSGKKIDLYVYNSQNATPDVAAQVSAAKRHGIAVATVTETLSPVGATFAQWQTDQLKKIETALAQATGR